MDPNLELKCHVGCKELLLRKLSYAVTSSVLSQVIIISGFSFVVNFNVLHPMEWLYQSFSSLTSITTWLFVIPFLSIIFAQSIICAKDYVVKSKYYPTRIQKFFSVFSLHNLLLLVLHFVIGGVEVWLFLSLAGGNHGSLYVSCKTEYCLNTETFYLILSGFWTGLYFFLTIYTSEKKILFPVVPQRKLLQFKTTLFPLLKQSQRAALKPAVYYYVAYWLWGQRLQSSFTSFFGLQTDEEASLNLIRTAYAWFFASLFIFNMNLMRSFYEMFLTEPIQFPIVAAAKDDFTLVDAVNITNIPIIQQLACLDLFLLSNNSKQRREILYMLSQPGNHPHNWNHLIENVLNIINNYTEMLNKSAVVLNPDQVKKIDVAPPPVISPLKNYSFMRNMSLQNEQMPFDIEVVQTKRQFPVSVDSWTAKMAEKFNFVVSTIKTALGINFLFGELPVANIQSCLSNGQTIIWTTQGLSSLAVASLTEDRFGIVQKDLPVIITSLVGLKLSVDKLNKIPALTRQGHTFDEFTNKMKISVSSAVKRSLYNICNHFGEYLKDLPLNSDVLQVLQCFVNNRSV